MNWQLFILSGCISFLVGWFVYAICVEVYKNRLKEKKLIQLLEELEQFHDSIRSLEHSIDKLSRLADRLDKTLSYLNSKLEANENKKE